MSATVLLTATALLTVLATAFATALLTTLLVVLPSILSSLSSNLLIVGVEEGRGGVDPAGPGGVGIGGGQGSRGTGGTNVRHLLITATDFFATDNRSRFNRNGFPYRRRS